MDIEKIANAHFIEFIEDIKLPQLKNYVNERITTRINELVVAEECDKHLFIFICLLAFLKLHLVKKNSQVQVNDIKRLYSAYAEVKILCSEIEEQANNKKTMQHPCWWLVKAINSAKAESLICENAVGLWVLFLDLTPEENKKATKGKMLDFKKAKKRINDGIMKAREEGRHFMNLLDDREFLTLWASNKFPAYIEVKKKSIIIKPKPITSDNQLRCYGLDELDQAYRYSYPGLIRVMLTPGSQAVINLENDKKIEVDGQCNGIMFFPSLFDWANGVGFFSYKTKTEENKIFIGKEEFIFREDELEEYLRAEVFTPEYKNFGKTSFNWGQFL